ncbi:hypothetical protein Tsubulata_013270 [Turnera subulata]|uniref:Uncharacterized protein n=1 Tax=Turnera subulata TaxID=218843 RepID=A0A9Q0FP11_9ROSI|nr:hypothetical protein Tsubulata_013270 [Turnera subulata]
MKIKKKKQAAGLDTADIDVSSSTAMTPVKGLGLGSEGGSGGDSDGDGGGRRDGCGEGGRGGGGVAVRAMVLKDLVKSGLNLVGSDLGLDESGSCNFLLPSHLRRPPRQEDRLAIATIAGSFFLFLIVELLLQFLSAVVATVAGPGWVVPSGPRRGDSGDGPSGGFRDSLLLLLLGYPAPARWRPCGCCSSLLLRRLKTTMIDEADGLEMLEQLQSHDNNDIYEKTVKILETF